MAINEEDFLYSVTSLRTCLAFCGPIGKLLEAFAHDPSWGTFNIICHVGLFPTRHEESEFASGKCQDLDRLYP